MVPTARSPCWLCQTRAPQIPGLSQPAYYRCPTCQLIFRERESLVDPAEARRIYELHENTPDHLGYTRMLTDFLEQAVLPAIQPPAQGLDFGCGPGPVLSQLLSQRGFSMQHYDPIFFPDERLLEPAYDLVTATEVLEHLEHPSRELSLLCRLLKPGGVLAVRTQLYHRPEEFATWWYRRDPTHICFYSPRTFRWLAQHFPLELCFSDGDKLGVWRKRR